MHKMPLVNPNDCEATQQDADRVIIGLKGKRRTRGCRIRELKEKKKKEGKTSQVETTQRIGSRIIKSNQRKRRKR